MQRLDDLPAQPLQSSLATGEDDAGHIDLRPRCRVVTQTQAKVIDERFDQLGQINRVGNEQPESARSSNTIT